MEVERYIKQYNEVVEKLNGAGDKQTAIAIIQEVNKDRRMQEMKRDKEKSDNEPATKKQVEFAKKLKIELPEGITKAEISEKINEALAKNNHK